MIGPTQRPLPDNTLHSQLTSILDPGGIRTRNPSDPPYTHTLDLAAAGIGDTRY